MLGSVNLWILALLIPLQILVYYAAGEMVFEYLRSKGSIKKDVSRLSLARLALETNFVNHTLPSGGVSGMSYMTWCLKRYGVSAGKATMAQVVRYVVGFASFAALLLVAVLMVTADGNINRWIIFVSSSLVSIMAIATALAIYMFSSKTRMEAFGRFFVRTANKIIKFVTFGKIKNPIVYSRIDQFFIDFYDDYQILKKDTRILIKPFLWGLVFTAGEAALFMVTFYALGEAVNPAPILIAYGLASMAGFFIITPGGAGAYEAIMVSFLAIAGISQGVAIAGILLTRIFMMIITIAIGYIFYQLTVLKYGRVAPKV